MAYSVVIVGGNGQTANLNALFATDLQVIAYQDGVAVPQGTWIYFISFGDLGADATCSWDGGQQYIATSGSGGFARCPAPLANGVPGSYPVQATVGTGSDAYFALTNQDPHNVTDSLPLLYCEA